MSSQWSAMGAIVSTRSKMCTKFAFVVESMSIAIACTSKYMDYTSLIEHGDYVYPKNYVVCGVNQRYNLGIS